MIAFVDIEKAFDDINWNIIFRVLRDIKVDYRDYKLIFGNILGFALHQMGDVPVIKKVELYK